MKLRIGVLAIGLACALSAPVLAADSGAATFKEKCAGCHGADGKGNTPLGKTMKNLMDLAGPVTQKKTDAELSTTITKGKGMMPPFAALTPEQVKGLVTLIRSFGKQK
jgi:mono/diheme cytochrome c family protein